MPVFPSLPDDALVKDVYPLDLELFNAWCPLEEGIKRRPSAFSPGGCKRHAEEGYVAQYAGETAGGAGGDQ